MINTQEIQSLAKAAGACSEGVNKVLESGTPEELISLYKEKIDFCLEQNFPSNEYLAENMDLDQLADNGIFLNRSAKLENIDFLVLLGGSSVEMEVNEYSVSQIYIKHTSETKLVIEGNAFVVIDCFYDSQFVVDAFNAAKVRINVYVNAQVTANDFDSSVVAIDRKNKANY